MLKDYQTEVKLNTLYKTAAFGGAEQLVPNIHALGGSVNIYTAQELPTSSPLTDEMALNPVAVSTLAGFDVVPSYMFFTGTATQIILSGIQAEEV